MRGQKRKKTVPDLTSNPTSDPKQLRLLIESERGEVPADEFFCVCLIPPCQVSQDKFEQMVSECSARIVKGNGRMVCGSAAQVAALEEKLKMVKEEGQKSPVKRRKTVDAVTPVSRGQINEETLSRSSRRSRPRISYAAMASGQEYKTENEGGEENKDEEAGGEYGMEEIETGKEIDHHEIETANFNGTESVEGDFEGETAEAAEVHLKQEIEEEEKEELLLGLIEGNYTVSVEDAAFNCTQCDYVAKSAKALKSHTVYMHSARSIQCDVCFGRFSYQYQMETHRQKHFDSDGRLTPVAKAMCRSALRKFGKTLSDLNELVAEQFEGGEDLGVKRERQFKCDTCDMVLPTEKALKLHYSRGGCTRKKKAQLGHDDPRMECPHCDFTCFRSQTFSRHVQAHVKPSRYQCDMCDYTNAVQGEVARHKRNTHAEKKIQCPQCTTKFRNHILLNQHIKQKHLKAYMRMCTHCGKEMQATAYKEHYRVFHGPEAETERRNFICQKCGRLSRTKRAHDRHMETAHTEENPEEEEIARTLVVNENQQSSCRLCGFGAKYAKTVVRHIVQVHAERRYSCELCGAAFAREKFLQRHVDIFHRKLERCSCDQCGRSFQSKQHLKGHVQRMHQPRFQHSCYICGKGFHQKDALEQHLEMHKTEAERTLPCNLCDQKFFAKLALTQHQLQEHPGHHLHVCDVCSEVFPSRSLLNKHGEETQHAIPVNPFTCSVCKKFFKTKKYLDKHTLTHVDKSKVMMGEGDSLFCTRCGEIFTSIEEVPNHVCVTVSSATEQVQDSYICMACGVQFSTADEAEAHSCSVSLMPQQALVLEQMSEDVASQVDHLVTGVVVLDQEGKTEESLPPSPPLEQEDKEVPSEIFLCGICQQMFETSDAVNQHILEHEHNGQTEQTILQLQQSPICKTQLQEIHLEVDDGEGSELQNEEVHLNEEDSTQLTQELETITMEAN